MATMKDVSVGGTMSEKGKYREIFNYNRRVSTRSGNLSFYISNYLKDDIQYKLNNKFKSKMSSSFIHFL